MKTAIILVYLGTVVSIGLFGRRFFKGTGEDYFVASRTIGSFVLLMTLFGTHMTAFSLLGASGEAYRRGLGVFSLMASSSALVAPAVFFFVGVRLWRLARRNGYLTQAQFFEDRWQADGLGLLLFLFLVALLVPYLLIGVLGGGLTFAQLTEGAVPQWLGSLIICGVILLYVTAGGNRSTAWVNTFQTLVFMSLGAVTFTLIVRDAGGLAAGLRAVDPALLLHGDRIRPLELVSYTLIPLSAAMFPHLFMHWLSARGPQTFRLPIVAYPLCVAAVWVPSVVAGVLGAHEFPGLEGPAANSILLKMIDSHAPAIVAGLLAAGVLAAVMSSIDSQVLSLSAMFTENVVGRLNPEAIGGRGEVVWGRGFVVAILAVTYGLSLVVESSLFKLGVWSFTGFAALFPLVIAALYWRRSTRAGAYASLVAVIVLWAGFLWAYWGRSAISVGGSGLMPVAVIFAVAAVVMVVVSLLTEAPAAEVVERFFPGVREEREAA